MVAQQVDHGLHGLADAPDASSQGVARDAAAEATQQRGHAVERHAELVLAGDDPGLGGLGEQPARDDARRGGRYLQTLVTTGAGVLGVLYALVLHHAHLLGDDVQLLADLGTDLHQRMPVMGTYALGLGPLVAHVLPGQGRIQWLAATLLALMAGNRGRLLLIGLGLRRLIGGREGFGLFEEQVLRTRSINHVLELRPMT